MKRYFILPGVFMLVILLCSASAIQFNETSVVTMLNQLENASDAIETSITSVPEDSEVSAASVNPPSSPLPSANMPSDKLPSDGPSAPEITPSAASPVPSSPPAPRPTRGSSKAPAPTPAPPKPTAPPTKITSPSGWYKNSEKGLKVPILMYHNLLEGSDAGDGLNVSEKFFEDQMFQLKAHGYNTIFFEQLYDHYTKGKELPENPIIITFDDGYKSNYTIGYPILSKYGMKACIFTITNAIGFSDCMNAEEIKVASESGVIEFQSHSTRHSYTLSSGKKDEIQKELTVSRTRLEAITSRKVSIFCYPYGRYSQNVVDELIAEGYVFAVTTKYGCASKNDNPFLLPRIRVYGTESGKALKNKIEDLTGRKTQFVGIPESTPEPTPSLEPTPEPTSEPLPDPTQEPEPTPEPDPNPTPEP